MIWQCGLRAVVQHGRLNPPSPSVSCQDPSFRHFPIAVAVPVSARH